MKKIVTLFGTLLLALCLCCGLVACGEGGKDAVKTESVTLDKTELTLEVGGEATLTATVTPENATEKTVTWVSNKPEIAKVENGKVTALAEGAATITASAGGKSATCAVTVTAPAPSNEVTADGWKEVFTTTKNFTMMRKNSDSEGKFQMNGETFSMTSPDGNGIQIVAKEGETYFLYSYVNRNWMKTGFTKEAYEAQVALIIKYLSCLQDSFAHFTFENGAYTCNSLAVEAGGLPSEEEQILENVKVVFENGALTEVSYSFTSGEGIDRSTVSITFTEINTTVIELPTEYTEL